MTGDDATPHVDCAAIDLLLAERASGPLPAEEELLVSAHLGGCAACQVTYREYAAALDAARLGPPPSAPGSAGPVPLAERRRTAAPGGDDLATRTLRAWRVQRRRRLAALALGGGIAAAAALTLVVFTPLLRRAPLAPRPPAAVAAAAWEAADAPLEASAAVESLDDDLDDLGDDALAGGVAFAAEADALP